MAVDVYIDTFTHPGEYVPGIPISTTLGINLSSDEGDKICRAKIYRMGDETEEYFIDEALLTHNEVYWFYPQLTINDPSEIWLTVQGYYRDNGNYIPSHSSNFQLIATTATDCIDPPGVGGETIICGTGSGDTPDPTRRYYCTPIGEWQDLGYDASCVSGNGEGISPIWITAGIVMVAAIGVVIYRFKRGI